MSAPSDKRLLKQLKTKDPDVFGSFYDTYVERVYRFVYFKVSSHEEAEDITAETFLKVWQYLFENKKVEHLHAFVYQVARNLVVDFYRRKAQQRLFPMSETGDEVERLPDIGPTVADQLDTAASVDQLESALRQLKDEYREVIVLRYFNELEIGEVAAVLGKSRGAVRVLLHRALKTLSDITGQPLE